MVYIGGAWDLLHAGDLSVLEQARALGDYLVVGVYGDPLASMLHVRETRRRGRKQRGGSNGSARDTDSEADCIDHTYPILSLQERVLSVLGCKYVSDVLLDAPYVLSSDLLASLNIRTVATYQAYRGDESSKGSSSDSHNSRKCGGQAGEEEGGEDGEGQENEEGADDPLRVPRERGMLRALQPVYRITGTCPPLSICQCACPFVCVAISMSVCLSVCAPACVPVCVPVFMCICLLTE